MLLSPTLIPSGNAFSAAFNTGAPCTSNTVSAGLRLKMTVFFPSFVFGFFVSILAVNTPLSVPTIARANLSLLEKSVLFQ